MEFRLSSFDDTNEGFFSGFNNFLNLFGDISNASRGDTIVNDGSYWVKTSGKNNNNVFINYKGNTDDIICKIIISSNESYEYILNIRGYLKIDDTNAKIDFSYIVSPNTVNKYGFNSGTQLIKYIFSDANTLELSLAENSTYSLEIIARPFYGKINNLQIQFDTSDRSKNYLFLP
jgi:hypothetical protein